MPTSSETTIVRVAKTVVRLRQVEVERLEELVQADGEPQSAEEPDDRREKPITSASRITERSTWRRDAPIVRSVANSRVRCATVIESVLKMTNAPTKSAMPANESRK